MRGRSVHLSLHQVLANSISPLSQYQEEQMLNFVNSSAPYFLGGYGVSRPVAPPFFTPDLLLRHPPGIHSPNWTQLKDGNDQTQLSHGVACLFQPRDARDLFGLWRFLSVLRLKVLNDVPVMSTYHLPICFPHNL